MKGFKITNLITNIIAFLYSFLFCGLIGGFSLLELFVGSWGKNDDAISESLILLLSSAVIILHGFLLVIFGGYAYSKWKNTCSCCYYTINVTSRVLLKNYKR